MMSMIWADEQGFTLIEMLVSMMLMVLVAAAVYGVFAYGSAYYMVGDAITGLQRTAYGAMEQMSRTLKEAQTVDMPSTLHPTGNADDCIDITNQDGNTTSYFYSNGNLLRNNNDGSDDITLIDGGTYLTGIQFIDKTPIITVKLKVKLGNTTISKSGRGNIVLVESDSWEWWIWSWTECGEDCIELYTDNVLRIMVLTAE